MNAKLMRMNVRRFDEERVPVLEMVNAPAIAAYWNLVNAEPEPQLGEELFPTERNETMDIKWFKGQTGAPIALRPSALDADVIPRDRDAFDEMSTEMSLFRESKYVDEKLHQELIRVRGGSDTYIKSLFDRIFNDQADLLRAARLRLEINRMELLSTGQIVVPEGGQSPTWDYGFDEDHKFDAETSWTEVTSDPLDDIEKAMDKIELDTGTRPRRALFNNTVMAQLRKNSSIIRNVANDSTGAIKVGRADIINYLEDYLGLDRVIVYAERYKARNGESTPFVKDNTVILLPAERLGTTWLGTTPEEAALNDYAKLPTEVQIVDQGIAITTWTEPQPVRRNTMVSVMTAPTYENMDKVGILTTVVTP